MRVNSAVIAVKVISPNLFQQLFTGKRNALVAHKVEQQVIFLGGEGNRLAVNEHLTAGHIYLQPLEFQHIIIACRRRSGTSLHYRTDTCQQLLGRKGLGNVIINAQLKAEKLVILLAPGGKHDNRDLLGLANLSYSGVAVKLRHHDVHDYKVKVLSAAHFHSLHTVLRLKGLKAVKLSVFFYNIADILFIINNKNFFALHNYRSFLYLSCRYNHNNI